jgi:hypothetical protein
VLIGGCTLVLAAAGDVDVTGSFHAAGADAASSRYLLQDSLGGDAAFGLHASARTELTGGWLASVNSPPVAQPAPVLRLAHNDAKVAIVKLQASASDPDGDPVSFFSYDPASVGGAPVVRDGNFLLYSHLPGLEFDWITFRMTDGLGESGALQIVVNTRDQNDQPSQNVLSVFLDGDAMVVRFSGIPQVAYRVQTSPSITSPAWTTLGQATADAFGFLEFRDPVASGGTRFYRTIVP